MMGSDSLIGERVDSSARAHVDISYLVSHSALTHSLTAFDPLRQSLTGIGDMELDAPPSRLLRNNGTFGPQPHCAASPLCAHS